MLVEIWSDVVCPWCYIGKRRFEAALEEFEHGDEVEVVWRSYELNPNAGPSTGEGDYVGRIARKYGVPRAHAEAMVERMTRTAEGEGLTFRFDIARPGNSFDAHRLVHLGREHGIQDEVKERLFAAYQSEGRAIADHGTLVEVAVAAGLDEGEVRDVLAGDRFAADVRTDEEAALDLGITGVPHFVVDGRFSIPGAQDPDVLLKVLRRACS